MLGAEFTYGDKARLLNNLSELPQLRREASNIASAIDRQTRELKEELFSLRAWLALMTLIILLGVVAATVTMIATI